MHLEIPREVYNRFYDLLSHKIYNQFVVAKSGQKNIRFGSRKMWEMSFFDLKPRVSASSKLFETDGPEYFYRKRLEAQKFGRVAVQYTPLYKALEYIGIPYEKGNKNNGVITPKERCELLYDKFLELHPVTSENDEEFSQIISTISRFYASLTQKELLPDAWKILSPRFQGVWKNGYSDFELGYANCRGISNLAIFNISPVSVTEVEALIYYDDEIEAHSSMELSSFNSLLISHRSKFTELLDGMVIRAESLGISNFEKIEIHKLFDAVASEYIWYKCEFSDDHFRFFSTKKTEIVKRLYQCKCILIRNEWRIDRLRRLTTYSAR